MGFTIPYLLLSGIGPTAVLPEPKLNIALPAARFGITHIQLKSETFRLPCTESGIGLSDPHGSLPIQEIQWFDDI